MPYVGKCSLCVPLIGFSDEPIMHCYGASDRVTPGVLGGFRCSCECREWKQSTRTK